METMQAILDAVNGVLWHKYVLFTLLAVGVLFTLWSGFSQFRALTHGFALIRGKYDDKSDPGAINHFQALSTALSATVGLGNIGGVALAIALGGPGAVFWMWVVGIVGMALKLTEVTQSMLYRDTSDPDNPHGGPMWVASKGFAKWGLKPLGVAIGGIFCVTLIISAITGGNMFQAWNVAEITNSYFPSVPKPAVGIVLAVVVALVIIGGIKRIGAVAGRLVPFMCVLYLLAALLVVAMNLGSVPEMLGMIFRAAFNPAEAGGAFLGGTAGYAFLWGMKRALFSNEAGQGSAPIAHSAAKTDEPVREGIVSGLEPFIDTLVVCTLTTLVILLSGAWNRGAEAVYDDVPGFVNAQEIVTTETKRSYIFFEKQVEVKRYGTVLDDKPDSVRFLDGSPGVGVLPVRTISRASITSLSTTPDRWMPDTRDLPRKTDEARRVSGHWKERNTVFLIVHGERDGNTGRDMHRLHGTVVEIDGALLVNWRPLQAETQPRFDSPGIYNHFVGAALTGHAFDRVMPGLGMWLVTIACWLFAVSTMISWGYYGEQGVIYLVGNRGVLLYKFAYCALIIISTLGFIRTDEQLDAWTALGTGVMLFANIPIMLIFGRQAMKSYHHYIRRLRAGQVFRDAHEAPPILDVMEGKDVE